MKKLRMLISAIALLLLLPVNAQASEQLIPVGRIVGLQLRNHTVTIAAFDDTMGSWAQNAGLRIGDEIVQAGEREIHSPEDLKNALRDCNGTLPLTIRRGSRKVVVKLHPEKTREGYRLGVFLRQGIAGIGTVTFLNPETGVFGALGHGVNEPGGCLLQMTGGTIYSAEVLSVRRGKSGNPGQLKGTADPAHPCGELYRNSPRGVFGITEERWQGTPVETAEREELHTGNAQIRTTVNGAEPRDYSAEILKIYPEGRGNSRDLLLKITDPELLAATGGIVQGMSGSPILQDGKLIGAVTHVLIGEPSVGYGIFIGNMLEAAG